MVQKAKKKIVLSADPDGNYIYDQKTSDEVFNIIKKIYTGLEDKWDFSEVVVGDALDVVDTTSKIVAMQWLARVEQDIETMCSDIALSEFVFDTVKYYFRTRYATKPPTKESFMEDCQRSIKAFSSSTRSILATYLHLRTGINRKAAAKQILKSGFTKAVRQQVEAILDGTSDAFFKEE